jgi:hypothetical protein
MSNEFVRFALVFASLRPSKFVAGMRLHARAAACRGHTGNIAWRGSQANGESARRLRGKK